MGASSSKGPFMLAALILVILSSFFSEPVSEKSAQILSEEKLNTQLVQVSPDHSVKFHQQVNR